MNAINTKYSLSSHRDGGGTFAISFHKPDYATARATAQLVVDLMGQENSGDGLFLIAHDGTHAPVRLFPSRGAASPAALAAAGEVLPPMPPSDFDEIHDGPEAA